jgi:DNA-binding HxlR family transcriptional regulator
MPRRSRPGGEPTPGVGPLLGYQQEAMRRGIDCFGRKWTLLLLRDMAFLRIARFNEFLRTNPGLTPRVLSRRLRQMISEGLITRHGTGRNVTYRLTERGSDAVYILLAFLRYGTKYYVDPA